MPGSHSDITRTPRCGHGNSASCSTWPPPSNGPPNSTSFTIRRSTLRYRWRLPGSHPHRYCSPCTTHRRQPRWRSGVHYPGAPFVAISAAQERLLAGLNVVGTIHHAVDTATLVLHPEPEDYLVFLGRFTEGKGVLQAIDIAQRAGLRPCAGRGRERLLPGRRGADGRRQACGLCRRGRPRREGDPSRRGASAALSRAIE